MGQQTLGGVTFREQLSRWRCNLDRGAITFNSLTVFAGILVADVGKGAVLIHRKSMKQRRVTGRRGHLIPPALREETQLLIAP